MGYSQQKKMSGPIVGQIDMCDGCTKDRKIFFMGKVKQYLSPERTTFLCEECFHRRCFCAICCGNTTYSSYERHLIENHTIEQMANQLLNEKVYSDHL